MSYVKLRRLSAFMPRMKSGRSMKRSSASAWTVFFFSSRRRHTRLVSDWSSDVCSSDLRHVLLDIDVQGAAQVQGRYPPPQSIGIFILPPSAAAWGRRLVGRGTESPASLERRLEQAIAEIRQSSDWRHIVINDDLNGAVGEVARIIDEDGARPHRPRPDQVSRLVEALVREADRLRHGVKGD